MCQICDFHRGRALEQRAAAETATPENRLGHLELADLHDAQLAEHRKTHETPVSARWRLKDHERRSAAALAAARKLRLVDVDEGGMDL